MSDALRRQKLEQAGRLVAESGADVWLTFVRETGEGGDPILPYLLEGGLTWQSALLIARDGRRIAIAGRYDADPIAATGDWNEVMPYDQGIRQPLVETLERLCGPEPRILVNYSANDPKADGLTHGMYLLLEQYLEGTRFAGRLESAESVVMAVRGRKTAEELRRMRAAIAATDRIFGLVEELARPGLTEKEIFDFIQHEIDGSGLGYAWDRMQCPIVNSGPDSMIGHGVPSPSIHIAPGHILHIDLGVTVEGYSSDIQTCWYVPQPGETAPPDDVQRATAAVVAAISAAADALKPGVEGWQVDDAARRSLVAAGYEEYLHATGHQVGRVAHDGGAVLAPRWERYGRTPYIPVQAGEVYTLELGVVLLGRGYLGIEEMVVVTESGCEWLTDRQSTMPVLGAGTENH